MAASFQPDTHPFVRKVESIALFTLSADEKAALFALPMQVADFGPRQDIVREHDRPSQCFTLLKGFACLYKSTPAGMRQIMAYHVPGDMPDLQSLHLKVLDNGIATVSPCRIGLVQHEAVRALFRTHPRLADAFWRLTLIDAALLREWIVNIGRRHAYTRMAHLFCELVTRLEAVGLAQDHACDLPMTQTELADALGLTTVHVNRTLQELRSAGLVTLRGGRLTVNDWEGLTAIAGFDPIYLHLKQFEAS
ncbi:Crp/Fnr family transcriptional regulator [Methylobacterium nodulans]|uniref:Transcriptional regulator, Crp/Fnr family n=1 Tax=Methylobacterium nodulans (strain LMG 21967 / CNCM I-2342 / ORS 2060) TaxID=460265 RepID=B8IT92_METNO|nr:Crp/Fnr family transcriptional regulator [Methylobacterium nodulans]ACL56978.1 transcriptional regulator, Crp/Fnr family [Methylobacterium nodulans ORS 2060]